MTRSISALTDLEDAGGAFLGVYEMVFFQNFLYFVCPIARGNRDIDKSAGSVLYRFGVSALTLEKLDSAEFVHYGFAGLTVHANAVYYMQSPIEVYKYPAYNPDLESYNAEDAVNYLPDFKGNLKRVLDTAVIQDCGTIRFDEGAAFRGMLCRGLSAGDALHLMVVQDSPDALMQRDSVLSMPSSALWCVFGKKLQFVLDAVPTSGTLDTALTKIATQVNATFSVDRGVASVKNRATVGALLMGSITPLSTSLTYDNANRAELPASGNVLVDAEIIGYSGRTATQLTGLTRGLLLTVATSHANNAEITFLDELVSDAAFVGEMVWSVDTAHLYNTISDAQLIKLKDALSPFAEKSLNLGLDLDGLRIPWLAFVAGEYLSRFKDVRFLLNAPLYPFVDVKIGDIVGIHYRSLPPLAMQVMRISYASDETVIVGREAVPNITPQPDPPPMSFVFDALVVNQSWTQFMEIPAFTMPRAIGGVAPYGYTLTGLPEGVFFNDKTLRVYGTPDDAVSALNATYTAIDATNASITQTMQIDVSAASVESRIITDGVGDTLVVDGVGDRVVFYGR